MGSFKSKALSEVMAASMQSMALPESARHGDGTPVENTEETCEFGAAENYYLRLIENDEGELETVRIPTGRVGGYSPQERMLQGRRVVSDDLKGILQDLEQNEGFGSGKIVAEFGGDDVLGEEVEEEEVLHQRMRPHEFQMPHVPSALQKDQGVQVDTIREAGDNQKLQELGPEGDLIQKQAVDVSFQGFELVEDNDGNLQTAEVHSDHPKVDRVDTGELFREMEESFQNFDYLEGHESEQSGIDGEGPFEEIQEEIVTAEQKQNTEYQMPGLSAAIQKEQYVQVDTLITEHEEMIVKYEQAIIDLNESIERKKKEVKNEFERVRREFKAEQARVVEEMKQQFEAERAEADEDFKQEKQKFEMAKLKLQEQLEASPGGGIIQKEEVDISEANIQFAEDEYGNLQASRVKSESGRAKDEVSLKEIVQSLESINDLDKDEDTMETIREDDIQQEVQEEMFTQQAVQLTEHQMSNMDNAFHREQAVQVDILVWKPPSDFVSKLAQTDSAKLTSKESQTLQAGCKDVSVQTVRGESDSRLTQTEAVRVKEMAVQLETLKLKDKSSQWEIAQEKVGVQTVPSDVSHVKMQTEQVEYKDKGLQAGEHDTLKLVEQSSQWDLEQEEAGIQTVVSDVDHVKTQTESVEHKEKALQSDTLRTHDKASQWHVDPDQLPVPKSAQTDEKQSKHQSAQTAKAFKALTEVKSVQVKSEHQTSNMQTDRIESKDAKVQVQAAILENKGSQWEAAPIRTKWMQTEDVDAMSVNCQTDDMEGELFQVQYHVSVAEQDVSAFIESATQASQAEMVVSDIGTSMESIAMVSQGSQMDKMETTNRSSQWERDGDRKAVSMQTESRQRLVNGVQTEETTLKEKGQQASVKQTHTAIQHQADMQHDASQIAASSDAKSTQTLLRTEDQKLQTDKLETANRGSQSEMRSQSHSHVKVQTDSHARRDSKIQTEWNKPKLVDANVQAKSKQVEKQMQASADHKEQHVQADFGAPVKEEMAVKVRPHFSFSMSHGHRFFESRFDVFV